jgi:hypothetical protein
MKRLKQEELGPYRQKIEAAITDGVAKGKLSGDKPASEILAVLDKAYSELEITSSLDSLITIKDRKRWARILKLFDKLAGELDQAKDYWSFQRPPVTEPVPDVRNMTAKNAASYARDLQAMREDCQRHLNSISIAITDRKGDRDRARESFYRAVFGAWELGGGKVTRPTRKTKKAPAGGPMWAFFIAVVGPVFGREAPKVYSFGAIVERYRAANSREAAEIAEYEQVHLANRAKADYEQQTDQLKIRGGN